MNWSKIDVIRARIQALTLTFSEFSKWNRPRWLILYQKNRYSSVNNKWNSCLYVQMSINTTAEI